MLAPVDVPLGERVEQYRVALTGSANAAEFLVDQPSLTVQATAVAALGSGSTAIDVWQIGDFAASQPAQLTIIL